jgi:hypothetical protein
MNYRKLVKAIAGTVWTRIILSIGLAVTSYPVSTAEYFPRMKHVEHEANHISQFGVEIKIHGA